MPQNPPPRLKSQPWGSNPSHQAQIPASRLKSQPQGSNPSLEAQIPASRLKSQPTNWQTNQLTDGHDLLQNCEHSFQIRLHYWYLLTNAFCGCILLAFLELRFPRRQRRLAPSKSERKKRKMCATGANPFLKRQRRNFRKMRKTTTPIITVGCQSILLVSK